MTTNNTNQEATVSDHRQTHLARCCRTCSSAESIGIEPGPGFVAPDMSQGPATSDVDTATMRSQIREALIEHSYSHELDECMCGSRGGLEHVAAQVAIVVAPYVQPKAAVEAEEADQ